MDRNDSGGVMFAGGAVVLIVVLVACLKVIKEFFIAMGKTFDALALMLQSLVGLFIHLAIDAALLGAAIGAIYFTYRYVRMVRRGTDLKREVDLKMMEFESLLDSKFSAFTERTDARVRYLERELYEALKEPEVAPPPPAIATATIQLPAPPASIIVAEDAAASTDSIPTGENEDSSLSAIQNPY